MAVEYCDEDDFDAPDGPDDAAKEQQYSYISHRLSSSKRVIYGIISSLGISV